MKNNKGLFIGIAAVVVVVIAAVAVMASGGNKSDSNNDMTSGDSMSMDRSAESDTSSNAADTSTAVEATTVTIENYKYDAPIIKVKAGTTVTWTNKDGVRHNVAPSGGSDLPVGKLLAKGETYSYTFDKVGTFEYQCDPHPYMKGTVVVTE